MATNSKETIPKMTSSKIIGIQFSILSPDEIRNRILLPRLRI